MVISVPTKASKPRRSTRVSAGVAADVLIEVRGEKCAYAGETVVVSLHGALVRIAAPLKLGDHITLHVQSTGRSVAAGVVFADYQASHFGIELDRPENIWGMASTPADWNKT